MMEFSKSVTKIHPQTKIPGSRDAIASKDRTWRLLHLCLMRNFDPNLSTEAPWTQLIKTLLQSFRYSLKLKTPCNLLELIGAN